MVRSKNHDGSHLTDVELEMMTIIWDLGPSTIKQILAALPAKRNLAYTSVSTIVRILEQKGILRSTKVGLGHTYEAILQKDAYEEATVSKLIDNVFAGRPSALVSRLVKTGLLSSKDLDGLRELIAKKGGK